MPYIESFDEFQRRMGCPFVTTDSRYLFANGAQSDGNIHREAPTDPRELLPLEIEYLAAQLNAEERKFHACQDYISTQAHYHSLGAGPAPAEDAFTDLKRLQKNVLVLREEIQSKRTKFASLRGPTREQVYQEHRDEQRATAREAIHRAMAIEI